MNAVSRNVSNTAYIDVKRAMMQFEYGCRLNTMSQGSDAIHRCNLHGGLLVALRSVWWALWSFE